MLLHDFNLLCYHGRPGHRASTSRCSKNAFYCHMTHTSYPRHCPPSAFAVHTCIQILSSKLPECILSHPIEQLVLHIARIWLFILYEYINIIVLCIEYPLHLWTHVYNLLQYHLFITFDSRTYLCTGCNRNSFFWHLKLATNSVWSTLLPALQAAHVTVLLTWPTPGLTSFTFLIRQPPPIFGIPHYKNISATWSPTSASPHHRCHWAMCSKDYCRCLWK